MATIIPFRGLRYAPTAGPLADLVTPPYDVIDAAAQEMYYRRHPHNIIRLEYGKVYPEDTAENNRYTRAAACYAAWRREGVLVQEERPALYRYEQEFTFGGRRLVRSGFICAVKLEPYEAGVVLPHEETLPKHKADRLSLMRACRANFSPIFGLYADPAKKVEACWEEGGNLPPEVEFTGEDGQTHRLWVVTDPRLVRAVQEVLAPATIYIADGHHRYETALVYRQERRQEEGNLPQERPYDYVMMALVNLYDPGLVCLPTHRLVKNQAPLDGEKLLEKLQEHFSVEPFPLAPDYGNFPQFLKELAARGGFSEGKSTGNRPLRRHAFGLYLGSGRLYLLALRDEEALSRLMPPGRSPAWKNLDVSVLHCLILERILGNGAVEREGEAHLAYTREEEKALAAVDRGEYRMAFFLNPTRVEEVIAVAQAGEKMPQKSTYFYPKIITGLVINPLD